MGPTWSGSLKSLWLGDGEAIGDILVGAELAEQLGTEPMHPVLMDLCTGVAFPAFPAVLAAEQGVNDLFLPLRYGQVTLREKMPRRFYCHARWHSSALDSETQVFDLDFLDRSGRPLGGIREFTVKRAPARHCCGVSVVTRPDCSTPSAGMRFRRRHPTTRPHRSAAPG